MPLPSRRRVEVEVPRRVKQREVRGRGRGVMGEDALACLVPLCHASLTEGAWMRATPGAHANPLQYPLMVGRFALQPYPCWPPRRPPTSRSRRSTHLHCRARTREQSPRCPVATLRPCRGRSCRGRPASPPTPSRSPHIHPSPRNAAPPYRKNTLRGQTVDAVPSGQGRVPAPPSTTRARAGWIEVRGGMDDRLTAAWPRPGGAPPPGLARPRCAPSLYGVRLAPYPHRADAGLHGC